MKTLLCAVLMLSPWLATAACPQRATWPRAEWETGSLDATATPAELATLDQLLFTLTGADQDRKGVRTDGLVVIKGGKLVLERYARGWAADKPHCSFSVAKSVTSALAGVAVRQGLLSVEDSLCDHLAGYSGAVCDIKVKHVLTMSSGLQWQEQSAGSYQTISSFAMLLGEGHRDMLRFVLTHRPVEPPGARFNYSTGDVVVAGAVVKQALTKAHGADAFWTTLFEPLGITSATFEEDASGTVIAGAMFYATPRDYARLGYLYLNDGCWDGQRLLPEGWVAQSTRTSDAFVTNHGNCSGMAAPKGTYPMPCFGFGNGYLWWNNQGAPDLPAGWKDAPADTWAAVGAYGQFLIVIPSEDLVIVRTGDDREVSTVNLVVEKVNLVVKAVLPLVKP